MSISNPLWQDRDVRFDVPNSLLKTRPGEKVIDFLAQVEDTKGNNGDRGKLYISNLRVVWVSAKYSRINLSIGYKNITSITTKKTQSKLRGATTALCIMTKCKEAHFEFIFTNLVPNSPRLFSTVMAVHRAYETSRLYREVQLRGAILLGKDLRLLPLEHVFTKLSGVWNLCSDQGNLGTMYVTDVRVVWHSNISTTFNLSVPYIQMGIVKIHDSKFGVAMVMETTSTGGNYVLGFRVDPVEKLTGLVQEIHSLYQVYHTNPVFGVEFKVEEDAGGEMEEQSVPIEEDLDILESPEEAKKDAIAAYFADAHKAKDRDPMFSEELGLAIEKLPSQYTLKDLWEVS